MSPSLNKRKVNTMFTTDVAQKRLEQFLSTGDCYPFCVVLHPTMICNHRCDFCNYFHALELEYGRNFRTFKRLETDFVIRLLKELHNCGIESLIFSGGGDPLLHPQFDILATTAVELGFQTSLYSNLDFSLSCEQIQILSKLKSITVNINTTHIDLYKKTRGSHASLEQVRGNIESFLAASAKINAAVIIRENTVSTVQDTIEWLEEHGINQITVSPAFDFRYTDGIETNEQTINKLVQIRQSYANHAIRLIEPVEPTVIDEKERVICKTSVFDITIAADYGIYPCCMTAYRSNYRIVDLRQYSSFAEAWSSYERKNWARKTIFECKTCWFAPANQFLKNIMGSKSID